MVRYASTLQKEEHYCNRITTSLHCMLCRQGFLFLLLYILQGLLSLSFPYQGYFSELYNPDTRIVKISALLSPAGEESIIPVPTFACTKCGHVNEGLKAK